METHENNHEKGPQWYWDAQLHLLDQLRKGVSAYMFGIPNLEGAFQGENRRAACIDDRLTGSRRLAGLGILQPKAEAVAILREMRPDGLCWHPGCGAAAEAYRRLTPEEQAEYGGPDTYAEAFANEMAEALGLPPSQRAEVEPAGFHPTSVIYYDRTGTFDPSVLEDVLPPGFVISRKYMNKESAQEAVDFSFGIATGEHGFGARIAPGSEALFIAIGVDDEDLEQLKQELEEVASRHSGKVKVDGFIAPR